MLNQSLVACGLVMSLISLGPRGPLAQQSRTTDGSKAWKVPRTSWGHPDLQGIWTTDEEIGVPFERPVELGEQPLLSDQEFADRDERLKKRYRDDKADRRARPGQVEAGPEHWYEGGARISRRTSLVIDPPNGRMPEYTTAGKNRVVPRETEINVGGSRTNGPFDGPEDLHLADRCITRGLPHTWLPSEYNNGFQIVQTVNEVAILYERLHETRVIPFDTRPAPGSRVAQWMGESRARWEGDTLVIDVTNMSDRTTWRKSPGSTRRLTERLTRVDADTVKVEVTVDDPTTWTRPWTFAVTGRKDPKYWQILEYACHEGNYAMRNILSGARAKEKAAARGKKSHYGPLGK
jgi:hypothetical protein